MQVLVNQAVLTDGEVRATLDQMAQDITAQEQAITAQDTRECAWRENPHACTMANNLRDFSRMNPPVYFGSRTNEDRQEIVNEVHKFLCSFDVNEEKKD